MQGRDQGSGDQGCGKGVLRHLLQMFGLSEGSSLGGRWIHRGRRQKTVLSKMLQRVSIFLVISISHTDLFKGPSHLKQNGRQEKTTFSGTPFFVMAFFVCYCCKPLKPQS